MIRIFVRFLQDILDIPVEEIRATMRLYQYINEKAARDYWIKVSSLPAKNFRNSTYLVSGASKSKRPFNRLPYGTLQVWVADTKKFHLLIGFIEGVKEQK